MTENAFNTLGIISDIHGNYEALTSVLAALDRANVDRIVCLGDIIGYGASPAECVDAIRERNITSILGNHERYFTGESPMQGYIRPATQHVIEWTQEHLNDEQTAFIKGLSSSHRLTDEILLVHGSPLDPDEYILTGFALLANMGHLLTAFPGVTTCFFGHTHVPLAASYQVVETEFHATRALELRANETFMVNPGSVGQPRDGVPLASFAIYNRESRELSIQRVEYDLEGAQSRIREAGFEPMYAERLERGQ
jgi:predicted phosphodiesterase